MIYETQFDGADLRRADLAGCRAGHAQMIRTNLEGANMIYMDLRNARLNDARMAGADLSASWLWDANLTRAELSGAKMLETDFKGAYILNLTGGNPALASVGTNVTQRPMTGKTTLRRPHCN